MSKFVIHNDTVHVQLSFNFFYQELDDRIAQVLSLFESETLPIYSAMFVSFLTMYLICINVSSGNLF
jgi:hypothetical protein